MKVAVDVHYAGEHAGDYARAAAVVFDSWITAITVAELVVDTEAAAAYVPGGFYRRELPCLLEVLAPVFAEHVIDTVIVDGYVDLGPNRPGLGRHLHDVLVSRAAQGNGAPGAANAAGATPRIVGVAKSAFAGADAIAVQRGASQTPLWVSATSDNHGAAEALRRMHGPYRVPTLLRRVDELARGHDDPR